MIENIDPKKLNKELYIFILKCIFFMALASLGIAYLMFKFYFENLGATINTLCLAYSAVFLICYFLLFLASVFFNKRLTVVSDHLLPFIVMYPLLFNSLATVAMRWCSRNRSYISRLMGASSSFI